ncbi:MAG: threonylcarbamoyl-AMP synthase [Chitinophagaceae bacterium]|jgi:L-threonylcarbamoyladenylate synthase|nr:threonylcarbamoyl-AMP synthase [Chitinophagaceae bacterium]
MTEFREDIDQCLQVLRDGGTILYPTDTIWGIGCDATDVCAVEKVIDIKQRPANKSFVVLVADEQDILRYTASPDLEVFNHLALQTKPTTVIYEHAIGLADNVVAADGSVAIRLVKDEFCRHLIRRFRRPILSTSANLAGAPAPASFAEIDIKILKSVDFVVEHRRKETGTAVASTIIKWQGQGKFTIVRP